VAFYTGNATAQFYSSGEDPGNIRWNQFRSEHYHIIYPRGLDSLAMNFAGKLEYYYPHQAKVMDYGHDPMPVIFHNEVSFSNGIFVWAPRRLEIFTNPDPNAYPQDWLTELALHEGRHAFQVSKLDQDLGKALSVIAGEQAVGGLTGFLPMWYLEGDAVDAETRFSYFGRGRLPSFEMGMKAILLDEQGRYSFSKALLGSYKDYTPNHYELGYLMVHYGRRTYGNQFWNDLEDYTARKPYLVVPAYFSMKKYGVYSKKQLYGEAMDLYQDHWQASIEKRKVIDGDTWSRTSRFYSNYNFPQWVDDSTIVALKQGMDIIPEFVLIDRNGKECRLFRPGFLNSGRFSYGKGLVVWDEWIPDPRWSHRNYSGIRIYNITDGTVKNLGARTRYYSPAISFSGDRIAAVEQRIDHTAWLVVVDLDGLVQLSVPSPGNTHIQHPAWMEQDSAVLVTVNNQEGESIYSYSLQNGSWSKLFEAGYNEISFPVVQDGKIYFSASFSGIDDIYAFNLTNQALERLTWSRFGATEPSLSKNSLLFAAYHRTGYAPGEVKIQPERYEFNRDDHEIPEQLDSRITQEEKAILDSALVIPDVQYEVKPYNKLLHSINVHSWLPLWFDYFNPEAALNFEEIPVHPGVSILSQNLLSTVTGMVGYEYNNKLHYLHSAVRLRGRYPVLNISADYGGYPNVTTTDGSDSLNIRPNRKVYSVSTYVPIRFNTGKYLTLVQPQVIYSYSSDIMPNSDVSGFESGIHRFNYRLYAMSYLRRGTKDIYPRIGVKAYAGFIHSPFNAYNLGPIKYTSTTLFLPGVLRHQSLQLKSFTQQQEIEKYYQGNVIPMPRGLVSEMNKAYETDGFRMLGPDFKLLSADYSFPIAYPDLELGSFLYIKRIRGNVWTDYLVGKEVYIPILDPPVDDRIFQTIGLDLIVDFHVFRMFFPISLGVQTSYNPASGKIMFEPLFNISVD